MASQVALVVKNLPVHAGDIRDMSLIPGSGRSPGGGHGNPLQHSCLENPTGRGTRRTAIHRIAKSWTWAKRQSMHTHVQTPALTPACHALQCFNLTLELKEKGSYFHDSRIEGLIAPEMVSQFGFSVLSLKTDSSFMDAYCVHVRQWLLIAMFLSWGLNHDSSSNWILGTFKMFTCPKEGEWLSEFKKSKLLIYKDSVQSCFQSWGQAILIYGWWFTNGSRSLIIKHTMTLLKAGEDMQMA